MPSGKDIERMGEQIAEQADRSRKLIADQFTGMGPYTQRLKDSEYPQWWLMQQQKALQEQLAEGIEGWEWEDGSTTLQPWDKILSHKLPDGSYAVEGGADEIRRHLRTQAEAAGFIGG